MEYDATILMLTGLPLCFFGILLAVGLARVSFDRLPHQKVVWIGHGYLSVAALWKFGACLGLIGIPAAVVVDANWYTFHGVHQVDACAGCHVMRPMANDLYDPQSDNLAARHVRARWIPRDACFECHSDYGFTGDVASKMEGFRHLARYTTSTYAEPVAAKAVYDNKNCLKCHAGMAKWEAVPTHVALRPRLENSETSCLNCHGPTHPSREARTPGSPEYARLMLPLVGEEER